MLEDHESALQITSGVTCREATRDVGMLLVECAVTAILLDGLGNPSCNDPRQGTFPLVSLGKEDPTV